MHYSNGREARLGDVVKGKGYNIKHEIIGIVTHLTPGTDTCNITVACVGFGNYGYQASGVMFVEKETGKWRASDQSPTVQSTLEYGQCDAFVALDPTNGEVLLPGVEDMLLWRSKNETRI